MLMWLCCFRALKLKRDQIPAERVEALEKRLFEYYGVPVISDDVIEAAAALDIRYLFSCSKQILQATQFLNTVKPVYNDHYWDQKSVFFNCKYTVYR